MANPLPNCLANSLDEAVDAQCSSLRERQRSREAAATLRCMAVELRQAEAATALALEAERRQRSEAKCAHGLARKHAKALQQQQAATAASDAQAAQLQQTVGALEAQVRPPAPITLYAACDWSEAIDAQGLVPMLRGAHMLRAAHMLRGSDATRV